VVAADQLFGCLLVQLSRQACHWMPNLVHLDGDHLRFIRHTSVYSGPLNQLTWQEGFSPKRIFCWEAEGICTLDRCCHNQAL